MCRHHRQGRRERWRHRLFHRLLMKQRSTFRISIWKALASVCVAFALLGPVPIRAQTPVNDLVFTVGTTAHDNAAQDWSYVLIGSPQPELIAGKQFAVYGKTGFPTNCGTFTVRGTILQQTSSASVNTLLNQSVALGDDLLSLSNSLNALLRTVPGITNQSLAQKVLSSFQ